MMKYMTDAIAHRGPDGEGKWIEGNVGLGHRRLAIIDLTPAGHQPMMSSDGRYVISYNGEVYNFNELRVELEAHGHAFHSRTDSEVVLHAWQHWGEASVERFNGMFALALWDRRERILTLARDRYGMKPLYYFQKDRLFLFGSEVKALLAHPECRAAMDHKGLVEYFTFQNFFTDRTLFAGVHCLPPGTLLRLRADQGVMPTLHRFWDFHFQEPESPRSSESYIEELDYLMTQAVNRQMVADVEVGAYLSGGMDSGSVTALAARQSPYIKTFTCGFDLHSSSGLELNFDEREAAEHMSYLFRTEHYEMVLKAGDMERVMDRLVWHLEEPRVGQSYPNFYIAQLAGKFVKVMLGGTGGDELFGGYPWRYYRAAVNNDFQHYIDQYYLFWQRLIPNREMQRVFAPLGDVVEQVWTRDIFESVFVHRPKSLSRPEDYINLSLYFEARTFLHGLLVMEDKLSMAHGLESRQPFLDNDLVDFACRVPVREKLAQLGKIVRLNENADQKQKRYFARTNDGKLLLRRAMKRHLPNGITDAVKQGFSAPDASWFKGDSIDYVRSLLFDQNASIYQFLDYDATTALVSEHLNGQNNRRLLIWSLLNVEYWCRSFL